jgi:hypothetical protein
MLLGVQISSFLRSDEKTWLEAYCKFLPQNRQEWEAVIDYEVARILMAWPKRLFTESTEDCAPPQPGAVEAQWATRQPLVHQAPQCGRVEKLDGRNPSASQQINRSAAPWTRAL